MIIYCENCMKECKTNEINHVILELPDNTYKEFIWCMSCMRTFKIGINVGKDLERIAMFELIESRKKDDEKVTDVI